MGSSPLNLWAHIGARTGTFLCCILLVLSIFAVQLPTSSQDSMTSLDSPEGEEPLDADPPAAPVLMSAVLGGKSNQDVVIGWSLSTDDGAGDNDVSHYAVYFSQVYDYDGDGYSYLGQVGSGETQFTHTLAGDGDWSDYFYYVQANDTSGNTNWSGQAGKFVRNMEEGKQLASIPLIQDDTTLEVVLQTLKGSFKHVRYYKSSDQSDHWKSYWTFKTYGDLYEIDHKMGFWIDIKKTDHFVVAGLVPEDTQIELGHGWNLVGYPSFIEKTVSQALTDVDWEKAQGYGDVPPFHQVQLTGSDMMLAGEGYWIWVDLSQTWVVSNKPFEPPYIVWTHPMNLMFGVLLDADIIINFSEPIDTATFRWTITPDPGGWAAPSWNEPTNNTVTLSHSNPFLGGITTVEVIAADDMQGNKLVPGPVPNPWLFLVVSAVEPYIVLTEPYDGEVDVPVDRSIVVQFSEPMDIASVTWSFVPFMGFDPVWSNNNTILTLLHTAPFSECIWYTVEINGLDLDGNPLVPGPVPNPFSFRTECIGIGPYILRTEPYDGEVDVDIWCNITIEFSEPIDTTQPFVFDVWPAQAGTVWTTAWSNGDRTVTLNHSKSFLPNMVVFIQVLEAYDLDGNPLVPGPVPNPWWFRTVSIGPGPYIERTDPFDGEKDVEVYRNITIVFSEPINSSSLIWTLNPDPGGWYEEWSTNHTVVVLRHVSLLSECTSYTIYVTYAEDMDGDPLVPGPVPNPWTFSTGAANPYVLMTDPADGDVDVEVNHSIWIRFSETMDTTTVNWSVEDMDGPSPIVFTPHWYKTLYINDTLGLSHVDPLSECQKYYVEIEGRDPDDNPLVPGPVPNPWSFATGCVAPRIVMTDPYNGEADVNLSRNITIQFSKEIVPSAFHWNLTMGPDPGGWSESWTQKVYPNDTVILSHNDFLPLTHYCIMIEHAKDRDGRDLTPRPFVFSFSTKGIGVYIVSVWPPDGETNVSLTECILINFSEPMDAATVMFTIDPPTPVTVTWNMNNTMMQICPVPAWQECTLYVVQITEGMSLQGDELVGGPVPNPFWFITVCINPYILSTDPFDGEMSVEVNRNITIVFSEPINPATFGFTCTPNPGGWIVSWKDNNTTVVLSHNDFQLGIAYTFEILYAEDMAGLPLEPGPVPNPFYFWT